MAQTDAEYEAALAAIQDQAVYYVKSDVGGNYYYLKGDGTLTTSKPEAAEYIFQKVKGSNYEYGFLLNNNGTYFSNPPGTNESNLASGKITTSTSGRANYDAQVFFLKDGKYAVRACNTPAATSGWDWVGGSFWTVVGDVDPVAQYQWEANYCWELEKDETASRKSIASSIAKSWPVYIQSAAGLVNDAAKYSSNAVQTSEGSIAALLDDVYTTYFHSCYSNGPDADHYLQAELTEATQKIVFYFKKRSQNNNNRPTTIVISASNDGTEFTDITTINSGFPVDASVIDYMSDQIDLGAAYKYVRFTVTATNNGAKNNEHVFFTFSEFYIFPGSDATAQVAANYNTFAATPWASLTEEQVNTITEKDAALKNELSTINVTYELYEADGTTLIESKTVVQQPGSDVLPPATMVANPQFFDYSTSETTVGSTDCTIKVIRTLKPGFVGALSELSNDKAYFITCDRGAFLTKSDHLASTAHSSLKNEASGLFAIISYEGHYYLYSVADSKFVKNNGELADNPTNKLEDAIVMEPKSLPYYLWHFNATDKVINTNGNDPYGYVINNYSSPDPGNLYYMKAVEDFDPTNAIAALDAIYHPSYAIIYVVKDTKGNTIYTSDPEAAEMGTTVTTLPEKYKRQYYTYNTVDVTVSAPGGTEAVFTATWNGPFEISEDYANAHWQNMAMRSTWYVTSAIKDGDGAYKTQNANTMGLVEDSYQWAFLGNGYDGFKIINKAEGDGKSFGWTTDNAKDKGIPTVMDDGEGHHGWNIVPNNNASVPAGSFCLGVPGTTLYINQYGGAGGSVKFWDSTNNLGDGGSAFTVFDVPTNFASFVNDEIAPSMEATGYFAFTDAAKAAIGWDPAYKTDCPFETYKNLKEKLAAAKADLNNFVMPETGYYLLKNKNYGTYMGIDPSDANMYGNYAAANLPKHIVKLTKTGDATYTIGLMGKFAPAAVAQSKQVTATAEAGTYTVVVPAVGYAAFQADTENNMSVLHCAKEGNIVGWEAAADASQWIVEDATSIELAIGTAGYATAYLPFPVQYGGPLPVPEALGTWTFDDSSDLLAGTGIATLQATTHAKNNVTVTDLATAGITSVEGPFADNGAVNVPVGSSLLMAANINATNIGTYSIMYDVCVEDGSTFVPLLQNSLTDGKDGSLFINKNQVGLGGGIGYHGNIENNKWYRIVFTVSPSEASIYVNGERLTTYNQNFNNVNGSYLKHWVLTTGALFFADEDGEEKAIKTSELRFWDVALNAEQVATLGSIGGDAPAFPEALGTWTFEDATDPYAGTGTATIAEWGSGVTFDEGVATVPVGAGIELSTNLESTPSAYTLMQDVKLANVSSYISLFQNDVNNGKDGSIFVKDGTVGLNSAGLGYKGTINTDTWYRIVTVIDNSYCTLYVDGVQVGKSASQDVNAWAMRDSRKLILFIDNDGEEKEVQLAEARFWDKALTAAQVAQLATVGTTIDEGEAEAKDAVAYTATFDGSKTWLELSEVNGTIPTKTAVILKGAPKTYVYNIVAEAAPVENNVLMGTLEPIEATDKYVLAKPAGKEVGFYKATSGNIAAGKAYLVSNDASIKAFYFAGDDATGIESVNSQNSLNTLNTQNSTIYNLAGQRISKMQKGINIVNGKKILK